MDKVLKNLERKQRILKLHAIVEAFSAFTVMEANRKIMFCKNDWESAESTKDLIHFFFPDRELKTENFIHNPDDLTEKVLDHYNDFKDWAIVAEFLGVPQKTLRAFCKRVENTFEILRLRSLGHLHYPMYFSAIYKYLDGAITKENLLLSFVEYSIFTGKATPASFALFRLSIEKIEKLIDEITLKQATRSGKSVEKFIDECQLSKEELAEIPF